MFLTVAVRRPFVPSRAPIELLTGSDVFSNIHAIMAGKKGQEWDQQRIRALRQHLGLTQQQLADELGTRQQTISEWETGVYRPRGTSSTLLTILSEKAGFTYRANGGS